MNRNHLFILAKFYQFFTLGKALLEGREQLFRELGSWSPIAQGPPFPKQPTPFGVLSMGHSEPAPTTSAPRWMDGKWSGTQLSVAFRAP
jgi:hypothetical protein